MKYSALILAVLLIFTVQAFGARNDDTFQNNSTAEINIAIGKSVRQSSTDYGGAASRVVDGNTDGNYFGGSVSHTALEREAWWEVDLGGSFDIGSIRLWNRTDCCSGRLSNFYLLVSERPFSSSRLSDALNNPNVFKYHHPGQANTSLQIPVKSRGRYVRVQLAGADYLSLAEVMVFGTEGSRKNQIAEEGKPVTIYWHMADDADVYLNGKPLRHYEPSFKTRPDEAPLPAFSAQAVIKNGDVFTVGGRRGGSFGLMLIAVDSSGRVVFRTDAQAWKVYEPGDRSDWYLPSVALSSRVKPVTIQTDPWYPQKALNGRYGNSALSVWSSPSNTFAYLYGVVGGVNYTQPQPVTSAPQMPTSPATGKPAVPKPQDFPEPSLPDGGKPTLDALLKALDQSLAAGNATASLQLIHPVTRSKYRQMFAAHPADLARIAKVLKSRVAVTTGADRAEYQISENGQRFIVEFRKRGNAWFVFDL